MLFVYETNFYLFFLSNLSKCNNLWISRIVVSGENYIFFWRFYASKYGLIRLTHCCFLLFVHMHIEWETSPKFLKRDPSSYNRFLSSLSFPLLGLPSHAPICCELKVCSVISSGCFLWPVWRIPMLRYKSWCPNFYRYICKRDKREKFSPGAASDTTEKTKKKQQERRRKKKIKMKAAPARKKDTTFEQRNPREKNRVITTQRCNSSCESIFPWLTPIPPFYSFPVIL